MEFLNPTAVAGLYSLRFAVRKLPRPLRYCFYRNVKRSPWSADMRDKQFIFVHVPKSGGSSVWEALSTEKRWLPMLEEYYAHDKRLAEMSFKFAFVRNPWDRLVSAYHYVLHHDKNQVTVAWARKWLAGSESFEVFLHNLRRKSGLRHIVMTHHHFIPQADYVSEDGRIAVDFLGRYENLVEDFRFICCKLGTETAQLPWSNRSARRDYKSYYSDEDVTFVGKLYARDVEAFGYTFEDGRVRHI